MTTCIMVAKCCIKECRSEKYPGCKMTFHGFPSDENLKTKWIEATEVTGSIKYKRICPLHFKNEDFTMKNKVIRLKQNVVPTFCKPPFRTLSDDDMLIFKSSNIEGISNNEDYENYDQNADTITHTDANDNKFQDNNDSFCLAISGVIQKNKMAGIARCKCCLESDKLKSMWQEYCDDGLREVYGIMLAECFALHWTRPPDPMNSPELICESCIARLRNAVSFKTEVLASEQLLSGQLESVDIDKFKQERDDVDVNIQSEYLRYETLEDNTDNNDELDEDSQDNNDLNEDDKMNYDGEKNIDTEVAIKSEPHLTSNGTLAASNKEESSRSMQVAVALRKRKQIANTKDAVAIRTTAVTKRLKVARKANSNGLKNEDYFKPPKCKRLKKQGITEFEDINDSLRKSIDDLQSKNISETTTYKMPRDYFLNEISTNCEKKDEGKETGRYIKNGVVSIEIPKIIDDDKGDGGKPTLEIKKECNGKKMGNKVKEKGLRNDIKKPSENRLAEMKKQANNIAIILESTNATPIRRHGGIGYGCCFCNDEFPDPADLKQHTIKEHDLKTKRNYAKGKRPSAYLVKLDITGLKCNICGNTIDSLEQLYDHLMEVHKKLLYRNAKNYIVPFKFDHEELRCLFCEFICNSFKGLLEHMSVHYRNHICEICDAGFLTKNNLFNHAGRHKKGTFKCDYCPKVFDTSSKKAGHQRLVHSSTNGVNRCGYCGEMFGTYRRKEKHLITEHGITLKKLKCKACDKTFETQTALRIHTKRDHLIERRFKCSVCDKRCFTNVQLNQHILKHTGVKKFQCSVCLKAYGRKSTLREHMRIHENDRRFKCELCGMAFVQKCSWRGHMLSKHGQQV